MTAVHHPVVTEAGAWTTQLSDTQAPPRDTPTSRITRTHAGTGRALPAGTPPGQAPSPPARALPGASAVSPKVHVPRELVGEHQALSLPGIIPLLGKPGP